ncbi:MAG: hypothetical protein JXA16_00790 [Bacteroidales bacterium]|nr:hypothetical protein [Bacteroidales bacterium]
MEIIDYGKKGFIDLVVVTHSCDDHIYGIKKMATDNHIEQYIKKYWFNSENGIAEYLGLEDKKTQDYSVEDDSIEVVKSRRQYNYDLYQTLKNSTKWNNEIICIERSSALKEFLSTILPEINVEILSPTIQNLKNLCDYWQDKQLKKDIKKSGREKEAAKRSDYQLTICQLQSNLKNYFPDDSKENGSSIALYFEINSSKFLLLGDSYSEIIRDALKAKGYSKENKLVIDFMKLSHHGSKNNINDDLLELIDCRKFVLTANPEIGVHHHPDKETLVRIINYYGKDNVFFYFNCNNCEIQKIFENDNFTNYKLADDNLKGITL